MVQESVEIEKKTAEQAVVALYEYLNRYYFEHRIVWMHDSSIRTEFSRGEAYALTGLALIPEVRIALDAIDEQLGHDERLGGNLKKWNTVFKPRKSK